jgi:hypothetical protein
MRDLVLIGHELRGMVATRHLLRLVPLAPLASLFALWPYIGSPFVPAVLATFITLEPFYKNTLNLWRGQMTSTVLLPSDLVRTLRLRNCALIVLTFATAALFAILVSYVQPEPPTIAPLLAFAFFMASIQFPLLILGNILSWQQIRPRSRWSLEDAAAVILMMIWVGLASVPSLLILGLTGDWAILLIYTAGMAWGWWAFALPRTAETIHEHLPDLWQQIHLT